MNRALEMWKEVTDSTEDVSSPAKAACNSAGGKALLFRE